MNTGTASSNLPADERERRLLGQLRKEQRGAASGEEMDILPTKENGPGCL